jgi:hypothetical protein
MGARFWIVTRAEGSSGSGRRSVPLAIAVDLATASPGLSFTVAIRDEAGTLRERPISFVALPGRRFEAADAAASDGDTPWRHGCGVRRFTHVNHWR